MGVSSNARYQMLNGLDMVRPHDSPALCGRPVAACAACAAPLPWPGARRPLAARPPLPACRCPLLQVLQPLVPSSAFRVVTSVIRGLNNMIGGISFVMVAKALGVQKAAEPAPPPEPVGKGKKKKK